MGGGEDLSVVVDGIDMVDRWFGAREENQGSEVQ